MGVSKSQRDGLLATLMDRFERHPHRHPGLAWAQVRAMIASQSRALASLHAMESTGGEPDVIGQDQSTGEIIFCDCSAESPAGRRSLCFDRQAWNERKDNKPAGSVCEMAEAMGIELLNEDHYRELQRLGRFDTRTSSWIETPAAIRRLGGALFGDRRYDTVFVYHNGAQSYYAARGFRGRLRV